MSWSIDWKCQHCIKRTACADRNEMAARLPAIVETMNTDETILAAPGDGYIAIICRAFLFDPVEG